jgi:predicted Zn-dependent protease
LQLAQKSGDGDFYQMSSVDARLRELRTQMQEDARKKP